MLSRRPVVTGALEPYDAAEGGQWSRPPAFPSGGAGLVSTVGHVLVFGPPGGHDHHLDDTARLDFPSPPNVSLDFWTSAYQAIDD
jgi:hypothetical protein